MALKKLAAAASLLLVVQASEASSDTCTNGECIDEESSLLALRTNKGLNLTKWFKGFGMNSCFNSHGTFFPCGDGQCCGNACKAKGDLCCTNHKGYQFPCQKGGECCGNACAAPGSKCCNKGKKGYEYPVSKGTACAAAVPKPVTCRNSQRKPFQCGAGSSCCGDICVGPGGTCCKGFGHSFVCGPGSKCCGNSCQAPGSKCCITKGLNYPVTEGTQCAGWNSGSTKCLNRRGDEFFCGPKSSCCGDICAGAGSPCCQNEQGKDFVCAAGNRCGKNVCLAN